MRFMPLDRKKRCEAAESLCSGLPIPTQVVASDEFMPVPQTERQRTVERGLLEIADTVSPRHGLDRRKFLRTSGGMAAAFMAINGVFGPLFAVDPAEAAEPGSAEARSEALRAQHIVDVHTHFLRDDTRLMRFVDMRRDAAANGWNPALKRSEGDKCEIQYLNGNTYAGLCVK